MVSVTVSYFYCFLSGLCTGYGQCVVQAIVEDDGFEQLATKLISIGPTYGKIDDILPCATTVSRHLSSVVSSAKERLTKQLESVKQFGVTTDAWTHQHTNDSYVTVTVQYVEDADGCMSFADTCHTH